jgi:murein DD-endopeptidase MepM/ murein hydrolase activator NlpD
MTERGKLIRTNARFGRRPACRAAVGGLVVASVAALGYWSSARPADDGLASAPARPRPPQSLAPRSAWSERPAPTEQQPAPTGRFVGQVVDRHGVAIDQVTIAVDRGAGLATVAITDRTGRFRMPEPAANDRLWLSGPAIVDSVVQWQPTAAPARVVVARRATIAAKVTRDSAPVIGAQVSLRDGSGPALRTERSDRGGVVYFDDLAPGPYELWAEDDHGASPLTRTTAAAGGPVAATALALRPATAVSGQLVGAGPLPDVTLALIPVDLDHAVRYVPVDPSGTFSVDALPRGRWQIELDAPGYALAQLQTIAADDEPVQVTLQLVQQGAASGLVVDERGQAVAGASVVVRPHRADMFSETTFQPTSAAFMLLRSGAGRRRWVHPLAGVRHLPIRAARRFGADRDGHRPPECGGGHCGVDIGQRRGSAVHAAADGVVERLVPQGYGLAGNFITLAHSGGLRTFYLHLDLLRPDLQLGQPVRAGEPIGTLGRSGIVHSAPHLHFAVSQDRGDRSWFIDPEPILTHAVVLRESGSLAVADVARPTESTLVATIADDSEHLSASEPADDEVSTDDHGRFRIDQLSPGHYVATAFSPSFALGVSQPFTVSAGHHAEDIVVTLASGLVLTGLVRSGGELLAGAEVIAEQGLGESARPAARAVTDERGRFSLPPLLGPVTLRVSARGHGSTSRDLILDPTLHRARSLEVAFDLDPEGFALRGRVVDPEQFVVGNARVRIIDGPGAQGRETTTDQHGLFVLAAVPAGRYWVAIDGPGYPTLRTDIDTNSSATVALEPGGSFGLQVRDAHSGGPLANVPVVAQGPRRAVLRRHTDRAGAVHFAALAPGRWRLRIERRGYAPVEQIIDVHAERREATGVTHTVELWRGATLAGVVRNRHGERAAGARVHVEGRTTTSDQDGQFRLTDVPTGTVELVAELDGERGAIDLGLAPGDELVTLEVRLD